MFCPLSHPNCSQQFWEVFVFLSECLRTNRMLDVEGCPMGSKGSSSSVHTRVKSSSTRAAFLGS